ncbi:hypothetical protein FIBSPDRAFT_49329 [Athelia psychrophila]|uniref:Zinc finger CHCC-type domain-containing protein n=1 Tax=Athelia psychrophila TaxID=1759441 RepID=A0A166U669_9AGAM|nr:hypothetical protein FIBSPDRAFT_49329 [Fibularhizoctonia sp. CBS 109695]
MCLSFKYATPGQETLRIGCMILQLPERSGKCEKMRGTLGYQANISVNVRLQYENLSIPAVPGDCKIPVWAAASELRLTTMLSSRIVPRLARPLRALSRSVSSETTTPAVTIPSAKTPAPQAPNYAAKWSENQRARPAAGENPRFEQTHMELQPNPLSAMEMIDNEPIRLVDGRRAACDGGECQSGICSLHIERLFAGGGPLGHPKVYINLDKPGPRPCGYCGIRFEQAPHHHH